MRKFEIVTHCWNYWRCLTLQLSSLHLDPPKETEVLISVCHTEEDVATAGRLRLFGELDWPENVTLNPVPMKKEELWRRAIGRNMCALRTQADWVWFADCDMIFYGEAIDRLMSLDLLQGDASKMVYPRYVMATSQERGDEIIYGLGDDWSDLKLTLPDMTGEDWFRKNYRAAIGGAQCVDGNVCREKGYLNNHPKWQKPAHRWRRTYEDPVFRSQCIGHKGKTVRNTTVCTGIGRIRHTKRGRFDIGLEM